MTDPAPDTDPADLPVDELTVQPLGEDGDSHIVVGTANPADARAALAAYFRSNNGLVDDDDDPVADMLTEARTDWYWQDAGDADEEVDKWLRAVGPSVDGRPWGNGLGDLPRHTDEPLFRGVLFS